MGKIKYLNRIEELFDKSPVVSFKSIEKIINGTTYSKLLVRNLLLKKKIFRLTKGWYTKHNESSLAVFCFKPSYLGLQSALSFHNLWEQETIPTIISSKNIRIGRRKENIILKRIDPKYLFGFKYFKDGDFYYPYSDIEKTFIDLIHFKQNISKEVLKEIKKKLDKQKLMLYLKKYPPEFKENFEKITF